MLSKFQEILNKISYEPKHPISSVNKPEHFPIMEKLFEVYEKATAEEQTEIRKYVKNNQEAKYKLVFWGSDEKDNLKYCYERMMSIAIREGTPDYRDDILVLDYIWRKLGEQRESFFKDFLAKHDDKIIRDFFKSRTASK